MLLKTYRRKKLRMRLHENLRNILKLSSLISKGVDIPCEGIDLDDMIKEYIIALYKIEYANAREIKRMYRRIFNK